MICHFALPQLHLPTKRRGEIAEAAFLQKAASLGFSVSKPWGESDRYDFILETIAGACRSNPRTPAWLTDTPFMLAAMSRAELIPRET